MPLVLPPLQIGAAAWYGPEMAARSDWLMPLTAADVREIEQAVEPLVARDADIAAISAAARNDSKSLLLNWTLNFSSCSIRLALRASSSRTAHGSRQGTSDFNVEESASNPATVHKRCFMQNLG